MLDRIDRENERVRYHYVLVDYLCAVVAGQARAASDADEVRWITRDEWLGANPHNLEPLAREIIEKGWQMSRTAVGDAS